ncbi:MAG: ABC transporter permease [Alphaproteobacteria bacterium]|nr:ABC transporter permease [Alphaproteobacteria bacterium]OJV14213.1 MAG: hypothetical protein BGO27_01785 [Alphaproteobacteria bacterium 33-17]
MFSALKKIISLKYLRSVYTITVLKLKSQYQGSYFGILWSMINPMAYLLVMSFIFSTIMRFPTENYILYMAPGIVSWNYIVNSITNSSNSLVHTQGIIKRAIISKTLFPASIVLLNTYLYVLAYLVVVIFIKFIVIKDFSLTVLLFPIVALPLIISVFSASIVIAYITPYFRDITHLLTILFNILFWTVPLAYPSELIPESKRILFEFHPIYIAIKPIMEITYNNIVPSFKTMFLACLVALVISLISYAIYNKLRKRVVFYI